MPSTLRSYRGFPVQCSVTYNSRSILKLTMAYISGFWLLSILLVLSSVPAYAEWVAVAENSRTGMTVYVNPDTIRRKGDLVKLWHLYDFKTKQTSAGSSFLSSKVQQQCDCAEERTRIHSYTWFSDNMGNGEVVRSNSDEQKWEPILPESVGEILLKGACGKQ